MWARDLLQAPPAPRVIRPDGTVLVWAVEDSASTACVTRQFTTDAAVYAARYGNAGHFESLFRQALQETRVDVATRPLVLDLGSGSGANSIVPCLRLFEGARFVATDLSVELLEMLARYAADAGLEERIACVVMDAMGEHVAPGRFDLVTGASILHHLDHPVRGLIAAARALRPGGHAIFFELFTGWAILRLAYQRILAEGELRKDLHPRLEIALRALARDIAVRTEPDPALFPHLDDKWVFSPALIEGFARAAGFSQVQIVPHNDHPTLYRDATEVTLRLNLGAEVPPLPAWACAVLDEFDAALPQPAKRALPLEGTLVLTR